MLSHTHPVVMPRPQVGVDAEACALVVDHLAPEYVEAQPCASHVFIVYYTTCYIIVYHINIISLHVILYYSIV